MVYDMDSNNILTTTTRKKMSKKTFQVITDTVYSTTHHITAHTQEEAEKIATELAYSNHHGEAIGVEIADTWEDDTLDIDGCDNVD